MTAPSPEELMAIHLSREVRDGEISACGALSMIPAAALLLAKHTHAPRADILILGSPAFFPFRTSRQFHYLAQRGELGLFFVSGVQIDRHGNYNLHLLGQDHDHPDVRFPGGYGGGLIYYAARRNVIFRTEHSPRVFVEQVDFISAAGVTPPHMLRLGGPSRVVTPLATLAMDQEAGVLKLASVHPPHTTADVVAATGFNLGITGEAPQTALPTDEELRVLRGVVRPLMMETDTYPDWAANHLAAAG